MVLKVKIDGDYYRLDLFGDDEVEVTYNVFPMSSLSDTGVSYTSTFEIPKTDYNNSVLNPTTDGTGVYECILESETPCTGIGDFESTLGDYNDDYNEDYFTESTVYNGNVITFTGTLYIDSESFNTGADAYSAYIVDILKKRMETFDEQLHEMYASESSSNFDYYFHTDEAQYMPVNPASTDYFFTSANFNGWTYSDLTDGIPVMPSKFFQDVYQVYWTWNYFTYLSNVCDLAGISYAFSSATEVTTDATLGNLYFGVCAPLVSVTDRSMEFELDGETLTVVTDYGDQSQLMSDDGGLTTDTLVGTCDTEYEVNISFDATSSPVVFEHKYAADDPCATYDVYNRSGDVYLCVNLYSISDEDGTYNIVKTFDAAQLTLGNNAITFDETFNVRISPTTKYKFGFNVRYDNYKWEDAYIDWWAEDPECRLVGNQNVRLDGIYTTSIDGIYSLPVITVPVTADVVMTSVNNYYPMHRDGFIEQISPKKSLEYLDITHNNIIEDIIKRYNIGVWFNNSSELVIGRIQDRYQDAYLDLRGRALDEKYIAHYSYDLIRNFGYKNKTTKAVDYQYVQENFVEEEKYSYGDVLVQTVNDNGSIDKTVSLKSSPFYKEMYGDIREEGIDLLDLYNDTQFWGVCENKQLTYKEVNIAHGYLESTARKVVFKLANVFPLIDITDDADDEFSYRVRYTNYSNTTGSQASQITMYFMQSEVSGGDSILLGDSDGNFNTSSSLIDNFEILFDITSGLLKQYIEIEVPLSVCDIMKIADGYKVYAIDGNAYLPIEMDGVKFDSNYSVCKLKLIKE